MLSLSLQNRSASESIKRIKTDYARHNAPQQATTLLEQLAATGQPVPRAEQTNEKAQKRTSEEVFKRTAQGVE